MENLLKQKLHKGNKVIGTMFQLGCSTAVECLGISGLDFFVIDTEHAPVHVESTRLFVMASELRHITPIVRIKRIGRDVVLHALDMGAGGLVAPGVNTPEEVRELVNYAKYPPEGSRGFALTRSSAFGQDESAREPDAYFRTSNDSVLVIPQCETKSCLEHIEEIVAIAGVDGIFVGPYDLSVALGCPARFDTPVFKDAVKRVLNACRKAGKFAMIFSGSVEQSLGFLNMGFQGVVFNTDVDMLIGTYKKMLEQHRHENDFALALPSLIHETPEDVFSGYLTARLGMPFATRFDAAAPRADLALIGGTLVLPEFGSLHANLYIKDGRIMGISSERLPARRTIDAAGKHILPGIIDPHVHFGIGTDFETDMHSETLSALVGGVTTVGCFIAARDARIDRFPAVAAGITGKAYADVVPHFVLSDREQLAEIPDMVARLGIRTFKVYISGIDGLIPSMDDAFVVDVMEALKATGEKCLLFVHCENSSLVERATQMTRQKYGDSATIDQFGESHPAMAEEEAVMRIAFFAKKLKQHIYVVHVSTKEGVNMVRAMKVDNPYVHAETTSPYLTVTADEYDTTIGLMAPPLRSREDQDRLWQGIESGDIDTIGTDNVALTLKEKGDPKNVWQGFPGYPALGTHLMATLNEGVKKRGIDLARLIPAMTKRPAEFLGIYPRKGTLMPGSDADIVLVDMDRCATIDPHALHSRSDFSLYTGRQLCAVPVMTIKDGKIVVENGKPVAESITGRTLVSR